MIELTNIRQDKPNAFTAIHGVSFTIDLRELPVFEEQILPEHDRAAWQGHLGEDHINDREITVPRF